MEFGSIALSLWHLLPFAHAWLPNSLWLVHMLSFKIKNYKKNNSSNLVSYLSHSSRHIHFIIWTVLYLFQISKTDHLNNVPLFLRYGFLFNQKFREKNNGFRSLRFYIRLFNITFKWWVRTGRCVSNDLFPTPIQNYHPLEKDFFSYMDWNYRISIYENFFCRQISVWLFLERDILSIYISYFFETKLSLYGINLLKRTLPLQEQHIYIYHIFIVFVYSIIILFYGKDIFEGLYIS